MPLRTGWVLGCLIACGVLAHDTPQGGAVTPLAPTRSTAPVAHDPDDPAVWVNARQPERSLILGTDKIAGRGGLYVFGLDGAVRQVITPLDRPNNVDVEYGLSLKGVGTDIAVVTERKKHRLRVFGIPGNGGTLIDLAPAGIRVLEGQMGEESEPMGIALYRRPADAAIFAIVAPKTGGTTNYLWQYRLTDDGAGRVTGTLVRRFGAFSRAGGLLDAGEIEAVAVDDALGFVYYSDERFGIRKYRADPDAPDAATELASFGTDGYEGDREGLAIYPTGPKTGYLVSTDQVPGAARVIVYRREGEPGRPHSHPRLATILTSSDGTDGLEAVATPLPGFPHGMLVMMTSGPKAFLLYDWDRLADRIRLSAMR